MRTRTLIGAGLALALAAGIGTYSYNAVAQGGPGYGPGWMMGGGYGPGYHMRGWGGGQGPGPGAGPWNCPAFAQDGQGQAPGQGYGPGYHMRDWGGGYGPGMMRGYGPDYGPGPGMMQGYGRGSAVQGDQNANQNTTPNLNLTVDDVKTRVEGWLNARGNPRLKVGEVKEKNADTITADVVTKDNSLVQRFIVDRHTGAFRQDNS